MTTESSIDPGTKPSLMEQVFGKKGTPLLWGLAAKLFAGVVLGIAGAYALGESRVAAYAVIPAAVTILAISLPAGPDRFLRGAFLGLLVAVLASIGVAASVHPVLAGILAAVVFFFSTAAVVLPHLNIEPLLVALGYFMATMIGAMGEITSRAAFEVLVVGIVGVAAGLAVLGALKLLGLSRDPLGKDAEVPSQRPTLATTMRQMLDMHQPVVRFALVRGVVLGIGVGLLTVRGADRAIVWVVLAIFAVMRPIPHDTLARTWLRIVATFVGVIIIGLAGAFFPGGVALGLGIASLLLAVLFLVRSPFMVAVTGTMLAVTVAGAPDGQYVAWAVTRFIETVIGGAIAIAVIFLVIPVLDKLYAQPSPD